MDKALPTFSVVCLCYNQARFVTQALDSILAQVYPGQVQLIIVDDASTDGSPEVIRDWLSRNPIPAQTLLLDRNLGNCRAFNRALLLAEGEFLIDLAADDQLEPGRLAEHARLFQEDGSVWMVYGDAWYVDEADRILYRHSDRFKSAPPEGDVFARLFQGNFICPSTVSFRTEELRRLGGYDERLAFEDFDIWMRLAREGRVRYATSIASRHRISKASLSGRFYRPDQPKMARSVVLIGKKALALAHTEDEHRAIAGWLLFQARLAAYTGYPVALKALGALYRQASGRPLHGFCLLRRMARLPLSGLYRAWLRLRYRP